MVSTILIVVHLRRVSRWSVHFSLELSWLAEKCGLCQQSYDSGGNPSVTRVYQETDGTSISQGSGSINLGLWGYDSSEIFLIFGWK